MKVVKNTVYFSQKLNYVRITPFFDVSYTLVMEMVETVKVIASLCSNVFWGGQHKFT